jgi:hypothetical protein
MNCPQARARLAELVYGDLTAADATAVEAHLHACPVCRRERADLEHVRRALDGVAAPEVPVDLPAFYRRAAERQRRRLRWWRRAALAGLGAAAAVMLVALGLRLEVRVEAHQVTFRWGDGPAPAKASLAPDLRAERAPAVRPATPAGADVQGQLRLLSELVQGLAAEADARDRDRQNELLRLRDRLDDFQRQTAHHWTSLERDVVALCGTHGASPQKGLSP